MSVEGRYPGGRQARARNWGTAGLAGFNAEVVPDQQWRNRSATSPCRERLEGRKSRRPMLTGTGKGTAIQSTLNHSPKADPDVLPKRQALEDSLVDTPSLARNGADRRSAGGQFVRRQPGFGWRHRGSIGDPGRGASRNVLLPWRGVTRPRAGGSRRLSHTHSNSKGGALSSLAGTPGLSARKSDDIQVYGNAGQGYFFVGPVIVTR